MVNEAKNDATLAAELALGVLDGKEKSEALRKRLSDPDFADNVNEWERRIEPMFDDYDDVTPNADIWSKINQSIDNQPDNAIVLADNNIASILERRLKRWRMGALGSGAIAASLAALLFLGGNETPIEISQPSERAVAQLTGDIEGLVLSVSYNPDNAEMKIDVSGMPDTDTQPEVWIISPNQRPQSLGQIGRDGLSQMIVASDHRPLITSQATLVLTMEPESEQPHDAPSGDPVASGKISFI